MVWTPFPSIKTTQNPENIRIKPTGLVSPGGLVTTTRPFIRKPRIGLNNKRCLADRLVPPGSSISRTQSQHTDVSHLAEIDCLLGGF